MFEAAGVEEVVGWVRLVGVPPTTFDEITAHTVTAHRLKNWTDSVIASLARQMDEHSLSGPGADAHRQKTAKLSSRESRTLSKRAELIGRAPVVGDAMASGEVSASHADALARAADHAAPSVREALLGQADTLMDAAKTMNPDEFADHCRAKARALETEADALSRLERQRRDSFLTRWKDKQTGMWMGRFALDPVRGASVFNAIDAEIDRLRAEQPDDTRPFDVQQEQYGAQALVNLTASGEGEASDRVDAVVHVHIDWRLLLGDLELTGMCELSDGTPIPVGTARRLACNAKILPVVLGSTGEVLDLGREERLASRAQRRALRSMYRSCAFPDCVVPFERCTIHHVAWWDCFGPTDLSNLVPLCERHHHLVHEGGWTLTIAPTRDLTVRRTDGTVHATVTFADTSRTARAQGPPARGRPPDRSSADGPSTAESPVQHPPSSPDANPGFTTAA